MWTPPWPARRFQYLLKDCDVSLLTLKARRSIIYVSRLVFQCKRGLRLEAKPDTDGVPWGGGQEVVCPRDIAAHL